MSPRPRTAGFHHHAIKVRNLAAAEAFYVGVLGLVVEKRWHYEAGALRTGLRSLWLRTDASAPAGFLALEQAESAEGKLASTEPDRPGHFLFALRIDATEREAWRAHLAQAGHPVSHETTFTLYVLDPEGNRLGLSHHPVPSAALPLSGPTP
jgi:catechol 2,3-dioxygenase-like lactoylglutathione lyase family enzyme